MPDWTHRALEARARRCRKARIHRAKAKQRCLVLQLRRSWGKIRAIRIFASRMCGTTRCKLVRGFSLVDARRRRHHRRPCLVSLQWPTETRCDRSSDLSAECWSTLAASASALASGSNQATRRGGKPNNSSSPCCTSSRGRNHADASLWPRPGHQTFSRRTAARSLASRSA